jgi:hypothetical protein
MSFTLRPAVSRIVSRPNLALHLAAFSLFAATLLAPPARAAAIDESIATPEAVAQLEARASQAKPREQCFYYTELVHAMTEQAGKQIAAGETEQAAKTLQKINLLAHQIHVNLANDTKRLKDAEMLMHHTTYRLGEYLHLVSGEDQATVKATLKQLDQVNDEILTQVFSH